MPLLQRLHQTFGKRLSCDVAVAPMTDCNGRFARTSMPDIAPLTDSMHLTPLTYEVTELRSFNPTAAGRIPHMDSIISSTILSSISEKDGTGQCLHAILLRLLLAPLACSSACARRSVSALLVTLALTAETLKAPSSSPLVNHSIVLDGAGRVTTVRSASVSPGHVQLTGFPWLDPSQRSTML